MNLKIQIRLFFIWVFLFFIETPKSFSQNIIEGFAQGTSYRLVYYSRDKTISKNSVDSIFIKLDSSLSTYKSYSLISQFNNSKQVEPDIHLRQVVLSSLKHYKLSKGHFDITVGSLKANPLLAIDQIGMHNIALTDSLLVKKSPEIKLDVDGIAQGYSVDVVADFLESNGIKNYIVELGGEIRTLGSHPNNRNFKVAVEIPDSTSKSLSYKTLEIFNTAITTSGKIRENGTRHHINAKTGKLTKSSTLFATVITPKAVDADALDNYLLTLSYRKALKLARKMKDVQLMLVIKNKDKTLKLKTTKGFPFSL